MPFKNNRKKKKATLPMLLDDGAGTKSRAPLVGALRRHKFSFSIVTWEYRPHIDLFGKDEHPHTIIKILQFPSSDFPHFLPFVPCLFQFHKLQQIEPSLDCFYAVGAAEGDVSPAAFREVVGGQELIDISGPQQQLLFIQLHTGTNSFRCDEQSRNGQGEAFAVGSLHSLGEERGRQVQNRALTNATQVEFKAMQLALSATSSGSWLAVVILALPRLKHGQLGGRGLKFLLCEFRAGHIFLLHKFQIQMGSRAHQFWNNLARSINTSVERFTIIPVKLLGMLLEVGVMGGYLVWKPSGNSCYLPHAYHFPIIWAYFLYSLPHCWEQSCPPARSQGAGIPSWEGEGRLQQGKAGAVVLTSCCAYSSAPGAFPNSVNLVVQCKTPGGLFTK